MTTRFSRDCWCLTCILPTRQAHIPRCPVHLWHPLHLCNFCHFLYLLSTSKSATSSAVVMHAEYFFPINFPESANIVYTQVFTTNLRLLVFLLIFFQFVLIQPSKFLFPHKYELFHKITSPAGTYLFCFMLGSALKSHRWNAIPAGRMKAVSNLKSKNKIYQMIESLEKG